MNQLSKKEEKEREERMEIAQRFSRRYNNARLVGYMKQPQGGSPTWNRAPYNTGENQKLERWTSYSNAWLQNQFRWLSGIIVLALFNPFYTG